MNAGRSSFRTCGMTATMIGGIRAVDWWLPMGIAVPMLSVVPVLVSSWIPRSQAILLTAAIVSLLTLINPLWVPSSIPAWIMRGNRLLTSRDLGNPHPLHAASAG